MSSATSVFILLILILCLFCVGAAIAGIVLLAINRKGTVQHTAGIVMMIISIASAAVFALILGIMGLTQLTVDHNLFSNTVRLPDVITSTYSLPDEETPAVSSDNWYSEGSYTVGKDIPAGEYYVKINDGESYADIIRKESPNSDNYLLYENCDTFRFITVLDGEYFETVNCSFIASEYAPVYTPPENDIYHTGEYRVGTDIPAGDYYVTPEADSYYSYIYCDSDSLHDYNSTVFSYSIDGSYVYISIENGEYLCLDDAKAEPIERAPAVEPTDNKYYEGMYRIGIDIPAGAYFVAPIEGEESFYFEVMPSIRSNECTFNEYLETFTYVVLEEGVFLNERCYFMPADEAPVIQKDGNFYGPGCYLVGKDIPAGEYLISVKLDASYPYYGITDKPRGSYTDYKESEYLTGLNIAKTVTVSEGEYLFVDGATFIRK